MPPVPSIRGERVVRALEKARFAVARIAGSHHIMRHPTGAEPRISAMQDGALVHALSSLAAVERVFVRQHGLGGVSGVTFRFSSVLVGAGRCQ
jgi:predicted RNA binding protein YcfA (HicA-like mRNA interferase family)